MEQAGFDPHSDRKRRSEDDLIEELQRLADQLGRAPTSREMDDRGNYSRVVYRNRWGSWNEALEAAGFESRTQGAEISDEDLLTELQRLSEELGRNPKPSDMKAKGEYSSGVYINRFGSWDASFEAADINYE